MGFIKQSLTSSAILIIAYYVAMLVWWITIFFRGSIDTKENFYFGIALGVLAIISGITGFIKSRDWGGFASHIGRALAFISFGFITWGIGTLMIGYYNIALDQSYPYPSPADLAYIMSWPLWFVGMFNLSKATGVKYQLKSSLGKITAVIIMLFAFFVSYYLLITVARDGVFSIDSTNYLRIFFDFAYPLGDVVILTSALLIYGLSFNYLGGLFKVPILLILSGFVLNYVTDVIFTYTNTIGTFFVASWVDMLYVTAFFLMGLGVNLFNRDFLGLSKNSS